MFMSLDWPYLNPSSNVKKITFSIYAAYYPIKGVYPILYKEISSQEEQELLAGFRTRTEATYQLANIYYNLEKSENYNLVVKTAINFNNNSNEVPCFEVSLKPSYFDSLFKR